MARFSIILPVRNGGSLVRECVASILSQKIQDFELIVLENASTDSTVQDIQQFNDARIKIVSSNKPLTIEENWHRALEVPKAEFMTLIGHDDILDEGYLTIMNELIRKHPTASLYQCHFRYINQKGEDIGSCQPMAEEQDPKLALHNFLRNKTDLMGTGFMMRSKHYNLVGGIPQYPNLLFADLELWINLSRLSYLAVDPSTGFSYRKHQHATTSSSSDLTYLAAFDRLVAFLSKMEENGGELAEIIHQDSGFFLSAYCQGITHRILRTPKDKRKTPNVEQVINKFREYGRFLHIDRFEPLDSRKIRAGKVVDNNLVLHRLFLLMRSVYSKPVFKS